jgi:hypothetical protein
MRRLTLAVSLAAASSAADGCSCSDRGLDDPETERLAALIEDAVDDECLDYYENGTWLKDIYFARGDWASGKPPGFTCYE